MDVHPTKNGIFIGIDPYPFVNAWDVQKSSYPPGAATRGNADAPWYWNWHKGGAEASQYLRMTQWHSINIYILHIGIVYAYYIFHVYPLNSFVIAFAVFLLLSERKSAVDQNLDDLCLVKSHLVSGSFILWTHWANGLWAEPDVSRSLRGHKWHKSCRRTSTWLRFKSYSARPESWSKPL